MRTYIYGFAENLIVLPFLRYFSIASHIEISAPADSNVRSSKVINCASFWSEPRSIIHDKSPKGVNSIHANPGTEIIVTGNKRRYFSIFNILYFKLCALCFERANYSLNWIVPYLFFFCTTRCPQTNLPDMPFRRKPDLFGWIPLSINTSYLLLQIFFKVLDSHRNPWCGLFTGLHGCLSWLCPVLFWLPVGFAYDDFSGFVTFFLIAS